jgi:hypothetical protein
MTTLTVDLLADKIIADYARSLVFDVPRKYRLPNELADNERMLDMILPNDKPLGKCTPEDVSMIGQAYLKVETTPDAVREAVIIMMQGQQSASTKD